jgi:2-polyprenyl-6-methoxyphenol hydroxylase-like FAD-dependent oxidoreductase
MDTDVIVVGAGPVGLMLAAEIRLAGGVPLVVERLAGPPDELRARGVGPLAAEALRRRGLGARLAEYHAAGLADFARDHGSERAHFASIHKIDPALQDEPDREGVYIWQRDLVGVLGEYASGLGVEVRRGNALTGLTQDGSGVTATVATPDGEVRLRARYLVGCDGGRSTVRKAAGFAFAGTDPIMVVRRAAAHIADPETLPPPGRIPTGMLFYGGGMIATFEFGDGLEQPDGPVTAAELEASVRRLTGVDVTISGVGDWLRFSDRALQATTYRTGRVLLAGDAAHVHSPSGGQGLNLGMMDAVNLGWKLAATVSGRAPDGLLDTYTDERHPVGAAVLHNTRAQSALLRPGPHVDALRDVVSELMDIPEVNRYFGRMMSGLGTRYAFPYVAPGTHPLVGTACPNLKLTTGTGVTDLTEFTTAGRTVLLAPADQPEVAGAAGGWRNRVEIVPVRTIDHDRLSAALIRPDGVLAWAAAPGERPDLDMLGTALRTWLGEPG